MVNKKKKCPPKQKRRRKSVAGEEYLTFLKNEFQSHIAVIRESVKEILDGLAKHDCDKCFDLLQHAMQHVDKMYKLHRDIFASAQFKEALNYRRSSSKKAWAKIDEVEAIKKELMGIIIHITRTPICISIEGISLILDNIPGRLNPNQRKILVIVKKNMDRLIRTADNVLNTRWQELLGKDPSKL